jgi:hypothetical protein
MVRIHGGALVSGESNDYDPTALVAPVPGTETDFATAHNCAFWTALEAG